MELLNTNDLIELCKMLKLNLIQCVSKSNLKIKPTHRKDCCYIINLDDFKGSHWTCIFINKFNNAVYMDSFAMNPPMEVIRFFKNNNCKWFYNRTQIQHLDSVLCGYFCVYYLFYCFKYSKTSISLNYINNTILDKFNDDDQTNNDKILQKNIIHIIKNFNVLV